MSRWDILIGEPINFDELVENHVANNTKSEDVYKIITSVVRNKLQALSDELELKLQE